MEKSFNPFGNVAINVKFSCDKCLNQVIVDHLSVPKINFSAETYKDSYESDTELVVCGNCLKEYKIKVWASSGGGYIEIDMEDSLECPFSVTEIADKSDSLNDDLEELNEFDPIVMNVIRNALLGEISIVDYDITGVEGEMAGNNRRAVNI